MPQQNLRRRGHGRASPPAFNVAPRRASGSAVGAAILALQLLLAGTAGANAPSGSSPAAASAAGAFKPADEFERLQFVGRAQPEVATVALLRYVDGLPVDSPRYLEALVELGSEYVGLNKSDEVEQVATRIDALSERLPLARPAAMLLRGQWMQSHGEVSKAEREIIEAQALLPAALPDWLRLRLLMSSAYVKNRGGHYDEAMARYNQALKLADESGPIWRRIDLRALIAGVLFNAGQTDKAAEICREEMRLAVGSADEFGISAAYTNRAIQTSHDQDTSTVLADWRAALEHARLGGSKHQLLIGMGNIADYYLQLGDFQTAYDLSDKALPLAEAANDLPAQSVAVANKGLALIGMHRKDEGLPLVRQSNSLDERSGTAVDISESQHELGGYLERAGYLVEALAAYHQYRQLSEELNQQDRQRALIELQESFANENRQHELDMLAREGKLKDEQIRHHELQIKQWTAAGVASALLLAVVAVLARRLRLRNQLLRDSNEQLRQQAQIDPLTGLSNRHHLQAVMAEQHADGLQGTLYLLDVDHFKQINDRCGHAGGDTVLVEIAQRLRQVLRDDDLVVRWGGEEFLVLVRPLPQAEAEALGQRLLAALADTPVMHDGAPVAVSASIGFAPFPLRHLSGQGELALDWERAVSLVDAAMYLAKAHGRNGACSLRRVDADRLEQVEALSEHLEKAAAEGRAELHFQHGPSLRPGVAPAGRAPEQAPASTHGSEVA